MLNNFKLSQYTDFQAPLSLTTSKSYRAFRQSEQSQVHYFYYLISDKFRSIERLIKHYQYWNVFEAFKRIVTTLEPYQIRKIKASKLKRLIYKHLQNRNFKKQLMLSVLDKFRQNIKSKNYEDYCLQRAVYIMIKQKYIQMARFFNNAKEDKKQQSFMTIMEKNNKIEEEQTKIQNQIIKVQKQNKIICNNCACNQIKNILEPILIKKVYKQFWQKIVSLIEQNRSNKISQISILEKQKAKFMKKSSGINQVQVLSKIIINGKQIKNVQKGMYDCLQKISKFLIKQEIKNKKYVLKILKEKYLVTQIKQKKSIMVNDRSEQQNDLIFTNVLNSLCYLSKKIQVGIVQKAQKKKINEQKLQKIFNILKRKQLHYLMQGFGLIKMQNFNYKISLWHRIQQLEQIKQKYFEYYNQTEYQEQQEEINELNF